MTESSFDLKHSSGASYGGKHLNAVGHWPFHKMGRYLFDSHFDMLYASTAHVSRHLSLPPSIYLCLSISLPLSLPLPLSLSQFVSYSLNLSRLLSFSISLPQSLSFSPPSLSTSSEMIKLVRLPRTEMVLGTISKKCATANIQL